MATSALNVLSGVAAAAAGLAGDKVSKNGSVPGLDLASIVPALLGNAGGSGGGSSLIGTIASVASKSGLLNNSKLGNVAQLAQLAGPLLSIASAKKTTTTEKKSTATDGIAGLAAAIVGNSGSGTDLGGIASLAATLAGTAKDDKGVTSIATKLGKTLSSSFGVSLNSSSTAIKAVDKVAEGDTKTDLFKAILKGLV